MTSGTHTVRAAHGARAKLGSGRHERDQDYVQHAADNQVRQVELKLGPKVLAALAHLRQSPPRFTERFCDMPEMQPSTSLSAHRCLCRACSASGRYLSAPARYPSVKGITQTKLKLIKKSPRRMFEPALLHSRSLMQECLTYIQACLHSSPGRRT